jgi:hypothetical protein
LDLNIETLKQPSASTNPVNQKGFIILDIDTSGFNIGIMLGKALRPCAKGEGAFFIYIYI